MVIKTTPGSRLMVLLKRLSRKFWNKENVFKASSAYFQPQVTGKSKLTEVQKKLTRTVDVINKKMSTKTGSCIFADFKYKASCIADRIYVMQDKPGELSAVEDLEKKGSTLKSLFSLFSRSKTLVLNQEHPYIKNLLTLGESEPHMAGYFLAKLLYIDDGVDTETDSKLASICLEMQGVT